MTDADRLRVSQAENRRLRALLEEHGISWAPDAAPEGTPWPFRDHRTMAEVMADEGVAS